MDRTRGFSLWLVPAGDIGRSLQGIIDPLAACCGTPAFPAHLTLLGQIEAERETVLKKARHLASALSPFEIGLEGVGMEERYFRALYLKARRDPPLMAASETARRIFERGPDPPFQPHLSLLYGDLPREEKERIAASLCQSSRQIFPADALHLYSTVGPPSSWFLVETVPLTGLFSGEVAAYPDGI